MLYFKTIENIMIKVIQRIAVDNSLYMVDSADSSVIAHVITHDLWHTNHPIQLLNIYHICNTLVAYFLI